MNPNQLKRNYKRSEENRNLFLVRSGLFYGLEYLPDIVEKVSTNRGIVSTPNFIFYENNTKVMIDFSDQKNTINEVEFQNFWKLAKTGTQFVVSTAEVYDSITVSTYVLNGTYVFNKIQNSIIFADVSLVGNLSTNKTLYSKKDFNGTPTFTFNITEGIETKEKKTKIVNHFGINTKNSFYYLGVNVGDFIKLQNYPKVFEIIERSIDSEGKEILTISGEITQEDRTSTITFIGIMVRKLNEANVNIIVDDKEIGSCTIKDKSITVRCYDNQTQSQCSCRSIDSQVVTFISNGLCSKSTTNQLLTQQSETQLLTKTLDNLNATLKSIKDNNTSIRP